MGRSDRAGTPARLLAYPLVLAVLLGAIELGVLEYTYERLGIDHRLFGALLLASLLGSLVNVRVGSVANPEVARGDGVAAAAAAAGAEPGRTAIAINLGGALVPAALSVWLLVRGGILGTGLLAAAAVAAVTYALARPVRGVGIAVPVLVPPIAAAVVALLIDPPAAAALAYAAASLGTLVGADLLNLSRIRALGAPVVSIGGAGTFDGVFLAGIIAVVLA